MTSIIMQTFLHGDHARASNGVFIDSCSHHCMSCSAKGEDVWNGKRVRSVDGRSASEAFAQWYRSVGSAPAANNNIHIQDNKFPCYDCCKCRSI